MIKRLMFNYILILLTITSLLGCTSYKCKEHTYILDKKSSSEASCIVDGKNIYVCSCGDFYEKIIPALGHTESDWIIEAQPNCTKEGFEYKECTICKKVLDTKTVPITGHIESSWIMETQPSCTNEGFKYKKCKICNRVIIEEIIPLLSHNYENNSCVACGHNIYTINNDKTITFGSYPQSLVTNSAIKIELQKLIGSLPTETNNYNWLSYEYYVESSNSTNFMWYQDIFFEKNKYRAIYFTTYRPFYCSSYSSLNFTCQDSNEYYVSTVYYFKYDPIVWKVLDYNEDNTEAFLFANMALDSQEFSPGNQTINGEKVYSNNYEYSTIRSWLNNNFLNTAFSIEEQKIIKNTLVDNSAGTTATYRNEYICNNTIDKIFLLSYQEVLNIDYGFSYDKQANDKARKIKSTDYAKAQGCYTSVDPNYPSSNGLCYWWLRSPYDANYFLAHCVCYTGWVSYESSDTNRTSNGVVPALWINL